MKTNFKLNTLIRENIKSLKPYSSARDEYKEASSKKMIFLDANENPFENGTNRYPDPKQQLVKEKLAALNEVKIENILLGNGSDEVLDLIFRAFCEPKIDNVITLPPTYGMYDVLANINAVQNRQIVLSKNFQPRTETILLAANSNSKILFLCSPNNPTGNTFNPNQVETLLRRFNGIVVLDEAYIDFSEQKSWLSRLAEFPNLIITQTLSKAYGMAGIRLGVCYASKEIIQVLNSIKPPYNVNGLTQQKALERLNHMDEIQDEINQLKKERKTLELALKTIDFIEEIYKSDANFLLLKVDNATERYRQLQENGIVVRNRTTQLLCENCLRITVGTVTENKELIKILKQIN